LRLINRSMMMARAKMEHAINGQMGHPAACMMENKTETPCSEKPVDYGAPFSQSWLRTVCGTRFSNAVFNHSPVSH
jgi:hypothetical protein